MSPAEAFAILGDRTRLSIIRVLWMADRFHTYEDIDNSASTMSFSELRTRVDVSDNGRFNYHLSKLVPQFVRKMDGGYRLSGAGKRLARTVATVAGEHDVEIAGEVETECPVCGGAVTATYEDQWLRVACTECAGVFGDAAPEGTLLNAPFPAPGLVGRTPDEALATELYRCMLDLTSMMQGVCPGCASAVTGSLSVCDGHDAASDRMCRDCGTPFVAWGELRCDTCRFVKRLPVELCVMGLAPVIGILYAQGINALAPSLNDLFEFTRTRMTTAVTEDPFGVLVHIGAEDRMTLTLDEHLTVVDTAQ
nr:ArsR family transcriptional regulator [Salinirubrum litoreum]